VNTNYIKASLIVNYQGHASVRVENLDNNIVSALSNSTRQICHVDRASYQSSMKSKDVPFDFGTKFC
jgi:hypothetical protein